MTDILVVEDRDSLRRMLATALASEGHEVVAVATGEEAVAKLGEGFDLVLTDLKLPGIDGLEVLRASRRQAPPYTTASKWLLWGYASRLQPTRSSKQPPSHRLA